MWCCAKAFSLGEGIDDDIEFVCKIVALSLKSNFLMHDDDDYFVTSHWKLCSFNVICSECDPLVCLGLRELIVFVCQNESTRA